MARRSKEDMEREEKMRATVIAKLALVIQDNWHDMLKAQGSIAINVELFPQQNNAKIDVRLLRKIEESYNFLMDDGQSTLELPPEEKK